MSSMHEGRKKEKVGGGEGGGERERVPERGEGGWPVCRQGKGGDRDGTPGCDACGWSQVKFT